MLFIKFKIEDSKKYQDFLKLYHHMVAVREPNFQFEEESVPEIDWDNLSEIETKAALEKIDEFFDEDPEDRRYKKIFPKYADEFLKSYIKSDAEIAGAYGFDIKGIFNYLEFSFEVNFDALKPLKNDVNLIEFSTGNYPFGGLERFIMTLKAFDLIPLECFDGFNVFKFDWTSEFTYQTIALSEKTKLHKEGKDIHIQEESKHNHNQSWWRKILSKF